MLDRSSLHSDELYHHGILGMKWGVRRYQNADGSVTPEGALRYYDSDPTNDRGKHKQMTQGGAIRTTTSSSSSKSSSKNQNTKTQLYSSDGQKLSFSQSYRNRLYQKYRSRGMSDSEAREALEAEIKREKIIAIAAAVGVGTYVASSYIRNKVSEYNNEYKDVVLKKGSIVQNITNNPDFDVPDRLYATYTKNDSSKYRGYYAEGHSRPAAIRILMEQGFSKEEATKLAKTYANEYSFNADTKIASHNTASSIFSKLYKSDSSFKDGVDSRISDMIGQKWFNRVYGRRSLAKKLASGTATDSEIYDLYNISLNVHETDSTRPVTNKFYKALTDQGYSGIVDINDQKYGAYKAEKPIIFFDQTKFTKSNTRELSRRSNTIDAGKTAARDYMKKYGTAIVTGSSAAVVASNAAVDYVRSYTNGSRSKSNAKKKSKKRT